MTSKEVLAETGYFGEFGGSYVPDDLKRFIGSCRCI